MGEQTLRQKHFSRLGILRAERASWFAHWQEITTYLLPRQGRFFRQDRNKGWKRHNAIFDNTGTAALRTLSAGLMGGLTSPARPWFRLGVKNPALMDNAVVKQWLSEVTDLMLSIFQRSNVYRALPQMYNELGAFGTAAAVVTSDFDDVIHIHPLTVGEYFIATNEKGEVDTLYREFEKPVSVVVKEYGYDNCSNHVKTLYDRGQLDVWIPILHVIEPRIDRDPTKLDGENMPWASIHYEMGRADGDKTLRKSGFKRFKVLAPRWDVTGGDIYGNSPGMEALGDIKQLQQEQLRKSQGIDYQTNPPLQLPTNLKNREVDRFPGGLTFRDTAGSNDKIETMFDVQIQLDHLLADIVDVRQRVRGAFFADMFLMLQGDVDTTKTATEVAELHEEKMLMLGPVLERLTNELLEPLIDITFYEALDAGILPPPPQELENEDLSVELISMLAQAQRAIATNSVDRYVSNMLAIGATKPEVLDRLDTDYWADTYADMLGVDPKMVVPLDKAMTAREARAKAQAEAQAAAINNQRADTANKLAGTPTQGGKSSGLDDILGMFSGYNSPQPAFV